MGAEDHRTERLHWGLRTPYFHLPVRSFYPFELEPFQDVCIRFYAHIQLLLCPGLVPAIVENVGLSIRRIRFLMRSSEWLRRTLCSQLWLAGA